MTQDLDSISCEIQQLDDRLAEVIDALTQERADLAETRAMVLAADGFSAEQQSKLAAFWGTQKLIARDRVKLVKTRLGGFGRMIG
ncbi:MAG TPA: hypothetical protein DDZ51_10455 [Planctomycetaceae bacterium]|nr:hypothetical protein [Planctomycetaceae bacterium]